MPDPAVVIEFGEIAANEPIASERGRLLGGSIQIAEHQTRIAPMDREQADGVGRERVVPPSTGRMAMRRPFCGRPGEPGQMGSPGRLEM